MTEKKTKVEETETPEKTLSDSEEAIERKPRKKEVPEKDLPVWNFPLQGRSVRARNLAEAEKIINTKE